MKKTYLIAPILDADGISVSQTPAAGGVQNLTITGALAENGSVSLNNGYLITITSAGNDSGRTFTVTGFDVGGNALSEAVTGANAGVAVTTSYFKKVTSIAVDSDTAGAVTAGVNGKCITPVFVCDTFNFASLAVGVVVESGTLTFSVQHTLDDVSDPDATITWTDHTSITDETATAEGRYDACPTGLRAIVTSFTSGSARFNVVQGGAK